MEAWNLSSPSLQSLEREKASEKKKSQCGTEKNITKGKLKSSTTSSSSVYAFFFFFFSLAAPPPSTTLQFSSNSASDSFAVQRCVDFSRSPRQILRSADSYSQWISCEWRCSHCRVEESQRGMFLFSTSLFYSSACTFPLWLSCTVSSALLRFNVIPAIRVMIEV